MAASQPRTSAADQVGCPAAPAAGLAECMTVFQPPASAESVPGFTPTALRSAYDLSGSAARAGGGETVAIVTAYSDPSAAADLAVYRKHFSLPACGPAWGLPAHCQRARQQHGPAGSKLVMGDVGCPGTGRRLGAVPELPSTARRRGQQFAGQPGRRGECRGLGGRQVVVNGWAAPEYVGQDAYDHYFNHTGVVIVAASGDSGYGRSYPADLPYVTSAGGTSLVRSAFNTRHWADIAWSGTGSACSALEVKPSWQRADASASTGCLNRTQNDVAADADPGTGAAVYDSYGSSAGWAQGGGTALAAAIVTSAYALAGTPAPRTYPASYPYQHLGHLNDVTFGSNGPCSLNPDYLCDTRAGFDGPTGLGTPEGTTAFSASGTDPVTVMDPGTQDAGHSALVSVTITGLDSRAGASLTWTASGLPTGVSVSPVAHSSSAQISGSLPAAVRSYAVTVTATDPSTHKTASTWFSIVAAGSLTPSAPVTGNIVTDFSPPDGTGTECLDGGAQTAGTDVTLQLCDEGLAQDWTYLPGGAPGTPAEITSNGLCLGPTAGTPALATCDQSDATQGWQVGSNGALENAGSGTCLDAGAQADRPAHHERVPLRPSPAAVDDRSGDPAVRHPRHLRR